MICSFVIKILIMSHFLLIAVLSVDFSNINLDEVNFYNNDRETIMHVRLMAWHNRFKQLKVFKKDVSKELIAIAWHPTRW